MKRPHAGPSETAANAAALLPPVLAYHKVGTPELGGTWCTARQLRGQLDALARSGWAATDLTGFQERLECAQAGPGTELPRTLLLTFDDAFESFARHAWPELERRGSPAVLFVVTAFVGRRATWDLPLPGRRVLHLDWPALRDLASSGVAIGSHGATHRDLRRLSDRELERELAGSRQALEDALGVGVSAVAYPFGRSDTRVRTAARVAGYACGFAMCPPRGAATHDRFALRRHGVYVIDGAREVLDKVDPARRLHGYQGLAERVIHACGEVVAWTGTRETHPPVSARRHPDR